MTKLEQLQKARDEYIAQVTKLSVTWSARRARALQQAAAAVNESLGEFSESIGEGTPINTESLTLLEFDNAT